MSSSRLVSIVIPAYKADFFEEALISALRQNHDQIEILVCDDCPTDAIQRIVERLTPGSRWPIRYLRNPESLGEARNIARGVSEARGEYIKFLYDDDILVADCTRLLFEALHQQPDIKLASGRRQRIDGQGNPLADNLATLNPFGRNVMINGPDLVSFLAQNPVNFIGEPSSVMCRRRDLLPFGEQIMSLEQTLIVGLGDMAMYLKLLRQGNLALLSRTLSYFRVSELQTSEDLRMNPGKASEGHANHYRLTRELGWLRPREQNGTVRVAPLAMREPSQPLDLRAWFDRRSESARKTSELALWLDTRKPSEAERALLSEHLATNDGGPAIAIVISDFNNQPESVLGTLQSLGAQAPLLDKIKVFVLADYDRDHQTPLQAQLPWLCATRENRGQVINQLLEDNPHAWWMMVDAGITFTHSGLLQAVLQLLEIPQASALFGDEVQVDAGQAAKLVSRPDFSLDYLLARPSSLARHWLFNREHILAAGGFDNEQANALELDLILRLIEHPDFTGFAHCCEPLVVAPAPLSLENPHEARTLQRHLHARGYLNCELRSPTPGQYQIDYGHDSQPLVSILVPCTDDLQTLLPCVESILEKTAWPRYEILIADNASQDAQTVQWLDSMSELQSEQIRILRQSERLSQAALINAAASQARGDYLLLLNNATSIIQREWLHHLLNQAQRPEVGVTGGKLVGLDGGIVNAGMVLGVNGSVSVLTGEQAANASFAERLDTEQNYSAVSADCLMVRTSLFQDLQGLDEQLFAERLHDVDLCLKVREAGHLVVWTPHAILASRNALQPSAAPSLDFATRALYHRWLHYLAWDPAYNRALALDGAPFEAQADPELGWRPLSHRPLPVVLVQPVDAGTTGNRLAAPLRALRRAAAVDGIIACQTLSLPEIARLSPDLVVLQGRGSVADGQQIELLKEHTNARVVYDLVEFPPFAELGVVAAPLLEVHAALRHSLSKADRITVPTQGLADLLEGIHPDVQVLETRLEPETWLSRQRPRAQRSKPRVGWIGRAGQSADQAPLDTAIRQLGDKVDWVIMGTCSRWLKPFVTELHAIPEDSLYPGLLAELDLDLAVVPAPAHPLNRSRDPVALLEFAACATPVIVSDSLPSRSLPVTQVSDEPSAWIDAILAHVDRREQCAHNGEELRQAVERQAALDTTALAAWFDKMSGAPS